MPVFEKQFYTVTVKEDVEMYSALSVAIEAESPLGRDLIYTISSDSQSFEIDYNTGTTSIIPFTFMSILNIPLFRIDFCGQRTRLRSKEQP